MQKMKNKRVLLKDEGLDWPQIWMAASSLDIKGNKATKKKELFFLLTEIMTEYDCH